MHDCPVPYARLHETLPVNHLGERSQVVSSTNAGHDDHYECDDDRTQHVEDPLHQFYRIVKTEKYSVDKIVLVYNDVYIFNW